MQGNLQNLEYPPALQLVQVPTGMELPVGFEVHTSVRTQNTFRNIFKGIGLDGEGDEESNAVVETNVAPIITFSELTQKFIREFKLTPVVLENYPSQFVAAPERPVNTKTQPRPAAI